MFIATFKFLNINKRSQIISETKYIGKPSSAYQICSLNFSDPRNILTKKKKKIVQLGRGVKPWEFLLTRKKNLDPSSAHPKSLINSIPFIQALRFIKIYSDTSELNKYLDELQKSFINRGYKENSLTDQLNQISEVTRESLLTSRRSNKPRIQLVLKFNRTLLNIEKIIDKHWHLLQINPKLKMHFKRDRK